MTQPFVTNVTNQAMVKARLLPATAFVVSAFSSGDRAFGNRLSALSASPPASAVRGLICGSAPVSSDPDDVPVTSATHGRSLGPGQKSLTIAAVDYSDNESQASHEASGTVP